MELTRREVFSFCIARKLLERFEGTPLELDLRSVLSKIARSLEGTVSLDLESLNDQFTVLAEDHARVDLRALAKGRAGDQPARACACALPTFPRRHAGLLAGAVPFGGLPRELVPGGAQPGRRACGNLRLSRCRTLAGSGQHFTRPPGFDAAAFFKDAFGVSQADQPWNVRLRFGKEVATYIRERVWHRSQRMRERRDGSLEMELRTSSRKELSRWVLSWVPHFWVLAPRPLGDRLRQGLSVGRGLRVEGLEETRMDS